MKADLTIGALAKAAGVNVETIRYYERRGLLHAPTRKTSGYRLYDEESLGRLRFIRNAQVLGFTLLEIKELAELRVSSAARCSDVLKRAERKLVQVEDKIRLLRVLSKALRSLIQDCKAGEPTDRCPILKGMDREGREKYGVRETLR